METRVAEETRLHAVQPMWNGSTAVLTVVRMAQGWLGIVLFAAALGLVLRLSAPVKKSRHALAACLAIGILAALPAMVVQFRENPWRAMLANRVPAVPAWLSTTGEGFLGYGLIAFYLAGLVVFAEAAAVAWKMHREGLRAPDGV
ncbi:MAG TPA: hypothetical protein VHM90_16945 [Phycisphaerae bacterium]|nr:hypothetical protein [Phycisphaerae bacterium]